MQTISEGPFWPSMIVSAILLEISLAKRTYWLDVLETPQINFAKLKVSANSWLNFSKIKWFVQETLLVISNVLLKFSKCYRKFSQKFCLTLQFSSAKINKILLKAFGLRSCDKRPKDSLQNGKCGNWYLFRLV